MQPNHRSAPSCDGCLDRDERIRQLEDLLTPVPRFDPKKIRMSLGEERVLACFLNRAYWSKQQMTVALYGARIDGGPVSKIIDTYKCRICAKIKKYGIEITTHWGGASDPAGGALSMTNLDREKLKALLLQTEDDPGFDLPGIAPWSS